MADDPTNAAVVKELVLALGVPEDEVGTAYEDMLRVALRKLMDLIAMTPEAEPSPEEQQAVVQALGRLHPTADDHLAGHGTRLRRLQARIDIELSRWTSAMVQPPGPSGATAVPAPLPEPVEG